MPKQFSDGKQTGFTTWKQNWWNRPLGTFSPWSGLHICLQGWLTRQDFCFRKNLSGERAREQLGADKLLVPIQKDWVRVGARGICKLIFSGFSPTRGGGTSGCWR